MVKRLFRETLGSTYYRSRPLEAVRYVWSKYEFSRQREPTVEGFLDALGLDVSACLDGYDRWEPALQGVIAATSARSADQGSLVPDGAKLLYAVVRGTRPRVVIETGVAAGVSTSFLGAALVSNGTGRLYSIDLPPAGLLHHADGSAYDWASEGGVGWAMPGEVRDQLGDRHRLVLEDVRTALPRLLDEVGTVDCFVHDDLHTPDHMRWEFDLVWPRLCEGGVLVSDDINHAWTSFGADHGMRDPSLRNIARVGALRKPGSNGARPGEGGS
jgi:hypothetical protein